jgi:hypothetical protein
MADRSGQPRRAFVGSPEVPQRFGAGLPNARVAVFLTGELIFTLGDDPREFEFLAEHVGEFFERHFDFANVAAGLIARFARPVLIARPATDRGADVSLSLSHTA